MKCPPSSWRGWRRRRPEPPLRSDGTTSKPRNPSRGRRAMQTRIDEIAAGIYRLSVYVPDIAPPAGFTFNHFLVQRRPSRLLFHCGPRPACIRPSSAAAGRAHPARSDLRWIALRPRRGRRMRRHERLARPQHPRAQVAARRDRLHGIRSTTSPTVAPRVAGRRRGARSRRPARALHRHAPRAARLGGRRALRGDHRHACSAATCSPISATARPITDGRYPGARRGGGASCSRLHQPRRHRTAPGIRKLAALNPRTLAVMHGASYHGNAGRALHALADHYDAELSAAMLARAA